MDKITSLQTLIPSLSKAEKRMFMLSTQLTQGQKSYVSLFQIIADNPTASRNNIQTLFIKENGNNSLDSAAQYLYKQILECLRKQEITNNISTRIYQHLSNADILFSRKLTKDAFIQLEQAKNLAEEINDNILLVKILRTEMLFLSELKFENMSEKELVAKQMYINKIWLHTRTTNRHIALYDILCYRINHKGYVRSEKQKDDLNDLVLSELSIVSDINYQGFEVQKLHILFQASYYINVGNYNLAVRFYKELILLFESNQQALSNPPIYYFASIVGVLDSLDIAEAYTEMSFFTEKLQNLSQKDYSQNFLNEVNWQISHYTFIQYFQQGSLKEAKQVLDNTYLTVITPEIQLEIYLYNLVLFMTENDLHEARKILKKVSNEGKLFYTLPNYRVIRLIQLIIHAENKDIDFVESQMKSIKREMKYEKQIYKTEKLIFKFVALYPLPTYVKGKELIFKKIQKDIVEIQKHKYERQILKKFDFVKWICKRLS